MRVGTNHAQRTRRRIAVVLLIFSLTFVATRSVQAQDDAQAPQSVPLDSAAMQQLVAPIGACENLRIIHRLRRLHRFHRTA
jgi:hypothetical protein